MKIFIKDAYGPLNFSEQFAKECVVPVKETYGLLIPTKITDELKQQIIKTIEEKGSDYICGSYCHVKVVNIPKGTKYRILQYDGYEYIEYERDVVWEIAN